MDNTSTLGPASASTKLLHPSSSCTYSSNSKRKIVGRKSGVLLSEAGPETRRRERVLYVGDRRRIFTPISRLPRPVLVQILGSWGHVTDKRFRFTVHTWGSSSTRTRRVIATPSTETRSQRSRHFIPTIPMGESPDYPLSFLN